MPPTARIPLLVGPTAVGKTRIAVEVASRLGAEIVSADSRQMYREFGVAVDKPSAEDRRRVPHHLVDCQPVADPLSAGRFAREAEATIRAIRARGVRVVVTGGSTLYVDALVRGLADIPAIPDAVRRHLRHRLDTEGPELLYRELLQVDPVFAATLDPTKSQRIVRGLEVHAASGRPLSSFFDAAAPPAFRYDLVVLVRDRRHLYRRIDARVSRMVDAGLVEETRRLMESGFDPHANPTRTIGYPEAASFLQGACSHDTMIETIRLHSRRYAKRQLTWYRRYADAEWLDLDRMSDDEAVEVLVRRFT